MTAKTTGQRPSALVEVYDSWAAYQFDAAVTLVGNAIENASQETAEVGPDKKLVPKYHMDQLLDPGFRLPRPLTAADRERQSIGVLFALARQGAKSGVKVFKGKGAS